MARRPAKQADKGGNDRFDAFLYRQFARVKEELETLGRAAPPGRKIAGRFGSRGGFAGKGGWGVGIAALVLAAVAVPLILQLNHEQAATRSASDTATTLANEEKQRKTAAEKPSAPAGKSGEAVREKQASETQQAARADAVAEITRRSRSATDLQEDLNKQETKKTLAAAAPSGETGRQDRIAQTAPDDKSGLAAVESAAQASPRYLAESDSAFRTTKEEIALVEKAELELLWKEYEKNPEQFSKDVKKVARLKLLLARHDTRSRAKRMKLR